MQPKRNYAAAGGFVLGLVACVSYFAVVVPKLGPYMPSVRDVPVLNYILLAVALWLSYVGVRRAFNGAGTGTATNAGTEARATGTAAYRGRWLAPILATLNLALAVLFLWYNTSLSSHLPSAANAPRIGAAAPDFTLADQTGHPVALSSLRGHPVLLVFYRGYW